MADSIQTTSMTLGEGWLKELAAVISADSAGAVTALKYFGGIPIYDRV